MVAKLFKLIKEVPEEQYSEDYIKFYAGYSKSVFSNIQRRRLAAAKTIKAINAENAKRAKEGKPAEEIDVELLESKFELYDLGILWKLMLAKQNKLNTISMRYLIQVLTNKNEHMQKYFAEALSGVAESKESTLRYFQFLEELHIELARSGSVPKDIKSALSAESLLEKVFALFVKYQTLVAGSVKDNKEIKSVFAYVST